MSGGETELSAVVQGGAFDMSGGELGNALIVERGVANVSGNAFAGEAKVYEEGELNISGGDIDRLTANTNSRVRISGGTVGSIFADTGSDVQISGGIMADGNHAAAGSSMTFVGGEFRIDGQALSGLHQVGDTVQVDVPGGSVVSGTMVDGRPFMFSPDVKDYYAGNNNAARERCTSSWQTCLLLVPA